MAIATKAALQKQVAEQQDRITELEASLVSHIEDRERIEGSLLATEETIAGMGQILSQYGNQIEELSKEVDLADEETTDALAVGDGVARELAGVIVHLHEQLRFAASTFNSVVMYNGTDIQVTKSLAEAGLLALHKVALADADEDSMIAQVTAEVVEELGLGEDVPPGCLTEEDISEILRGAFGDVDLVIQDESDICDEDCRCVGSSE
jgi:hypothetical protein